MPLQLHNYDSEAAVAYAHRWAYSRNPRYYDYEKLGGDCTNFASQCVYAGCGIMNHTPTFGWYYYNANQKAPAWTGVEYFYRFLTRAKMSPGPFASEVSPGEIEPGDIIQLSFDGVSFQHSPVVVAVRTGFGRNNILVAAHSDDSDNRPLATYPYISARFLHITGAYYV